MYVYKNKQTGEVVVVKEKLSKEDYDFVRKIEEQKRMNTIIHMI
jgi:hypothetical protein